MELQIERDAGRGSGGHLCLAITAQNGVSPNATQNFTLTVNQALLSTSTASAAVPKGTPLSYVTTSGFPIPTITRAARCLRG